MSSDRAANLVADRQGWVEYWLYYIGEIACDAGEPPITVVRRRTSPEQELDEAFSRNNSWRTTRVIDQSSDPQTSDPQYLV